MHLHWMRALGLAWLCLTFVACQTLSDDASSREETNDDEHMIRVAIDVEVQIELFGSLNLQVAPAKLLEVRGEGGSGLKLDDATLEDSAIVFALRGTKEGVHRLFVEYEDDDGKKHEETFVVSVQEIAHSSVLITCVEFSLDNAIPVGAEFQVRSFAQDGDDNILTVGDLNLVKDADGFELVDPEQELWRAPDTPGRYVWRLRGNNSKRFEWIVYDPASSKPQIEVATRLSTERPQISVALTPDFEGQPVDACILPANTHVDIEVMEGECYPAVGGVAFADGLSLAMPTQSGTFWAAGSGDCTLKASSPAGTSAVTSLNVDIEAVPFSDWDYAEFGDEAVELDLLPKGSILTDRLLRDCPNDSPINPSSSNCPSGLVSNKGCVEHTLWRLDYVKADPMVDYVGVGTGLLAELEVYLKVEHASVFDKDVNMLPNFMQFLPQSNDLSVLDLGCSSDRHIIQVVPGVMGEHEIKLSAEDTTRGHTHDVRSFDVARTSLTEIPNLIAVGEATLDEVLSPETPKETANQLPLSIEETFGASVRHVFMGEQRAYRIDYFDVDNRPLHGVGNVGVVSSEEDAGARLARLPGRTGFGLFAGTAPSLIEVSSPHASEAHRIYVEDEQGIAGFEGLELAHLAVGDKYCVDLYPLAEDGLRIEGHAPTPPLVKGARGVFHAYDNGAEACFVAYSAGEAKLEWTWGKASETRTWFVD